MQKLSMVFTGAVFLVGTVTMPARAALLDFNFTTVSGATGTFTLNTNIPPSPVPSIGFGPGFPGTLYPNAVSNFSFSSALLPQFNVSNTIADWEVIPGVIPGNMGNLSGPVFPSGCSSGTTFTCLHNVGVLYTDNLPKLSDDPNSYSVGLGIELYDSTNNFASLGIQPFSNYKVTSRETTNKVPEPATILGSGVALIICSMLKRKYNLKKKVVEIKA